MAERDDIRRRFNQGAAAGAPTTIDGRPLDAVFADARADAKETPEGRLILLQAEQAKRQGEASRKEAQKQQLKELQAELARRQEAAAQAAEDAKPAPAFIGPNATGQVGALEVGATFLTGALAEPVAGLNALTTLLKTGGDTKAAVDALNATRDAFTFQPRTAGGKAILNGLGSTIAKADYVAAKGSAAVSLGNPFAENLIYTNITKGVETALTIGGLRAGSAIKTGPRVTSTAKKAKELGIDLSEQGLVESVVESARRMTPGQRDANAGALRQSLKRAKEQQTLEVERLRTQSQRHSQQILDIESVDGLAVTASKQLVDEGFDVANMPAVKNLLQDISTFSSQAPGALLPRVGRTARSNPVAKLQELDVVNARIEARLRTMKDDPTLPRSVREAEALRSLDKKINDWTDHQFNRDMISGTPEARQAWKDFNQHRIAGRKWNDDRTLVQLMKDEATPEQINNYIMGAGVAKPKANAPSIVARMREVLGENHPSVVGIQQDFLHRVAAPLFENPPNFKAFIKNYDSIVANRPTMVKQLGLKMERFKDLKAFAQTADRLNPSAITLVSDPARALSQYFAGHGIARAGLRVRVISNAIKLMVGKNKVSQKDILKHATEARFNQPAIDPGSLAAGRIIQASVVADIEHAAKNTSKEE